MSIQQVVFALIYFAFGIGLIFLAFLIIRNASEIRLNRVTAAMLSLAGLGPIFAALGTVISPYQVAAPLKEAYWYNLFYIWELFFPVFLYFSWIFPYDRVALKRNRWRYLIFLPHVFHVLLVAFIADPDKLVRWFTIDSSQGGVWGSILEPVASLIQWLMLPVGLVLASHKRFFSLINLAYVITAVIYLYRGMKHVEAPRLKKQVRIIILGIHAALGLYIFAFIMPNLFSLEISDLWTSLLTTMALVIGAGSIAWAIIRYQFLDIQLIVRQSLVYTFSSAILVGIYLFAITRFSEVLESFFGQQMPLVNIGFIVIALILYQPINNYLDGVIKRMFMRDRSDYRNVMNRLSSQIINILDRDQLFAVVTETLQQNLLVKGAAFTLYDDAARSYLYFPVRRGQEIRISATDAMLAAIDRLSGPTFYDRLASWQRGAPLASMLMADDIQLIIPLRDRDHLLGFVAVTDKSSGYKFSFEDMTLFSTLANHLTVTLTNVRLYRESLIKQRLEEEMNLAREIQLNLLPDSPPASDRYSIVAHSVPSRTVGGDFYDFMLTDENGGIGLVIADVSGKGMPAALLAAQIQATLRSEVGNRRAVSETITKVNNLVAGLSSSSGKYATLFYAEYHPDTGEMEFANAGHNYPLVIKADGRHESLQEGGTVIGAFSGISYQSGKVRLGPDDLLFCYTDGLSEAMSPQNIEYGEKRLLEFLIQHRHKTAEKVMQEILREVGQYTASAGAEDDTTIIVMKINPELPA